MYPEDINLAEIEGHSQAGIIPLMGQEARLVPFLLTCGQCSRLHLASVVSGMFNNKAIVKVYALQIVL